MPLRRRFSRKVVCKVHSRSLPYYYDDKVSFFDLNGKKHIVDKDDFMDIPQKVVDSTNSIHIL